MGRRDNESNMNKNEISDLKNVGCSTVPVLHYTSQLPTVVQYFTVSFCLSGSWRKDPEDQTLHTTIQHNRVSLRNSKSPPRGSSDQLIETSEAHSPDPFQDSWVFVKE